MTRTTKLLSASLLTLLLAVVAVGAIQARAIDRKARSIRAGMTVREVMVQLDGWRMINTHPAVSRAIPNGTGPEFYGYSGETYALTAVRPDGSEVGRQAMSRAEFERRLDAMLGSGKAWVVFFSFRAFPTERGVLVRFDGKGRVAG
jgi:hypothetical protein